MAARMLATAAKMSVMAAGIGMLVMAARMLGPVGNRLPAVPPIRSIAIIWIFAQAFPSVHHNFATTKRLAPDHNPALQDGGL